MVKKSSLRRSIAQMWHVYWGLASPIADLVSASYFATEWHDEVIDPSLIASGAQTVHQVVAKTRGKTQYYQDKATFAFNLTWHDLKDGNRPMANPTREISELEAAALNHALSVRRKAAGGIIILLTGVLLEAFGVDISLLT